MLALTNDQIRDQAPSVFATAPWSAVSDRYRFVPTEEILNVLQSHDFHPVRVKQSRTRIAGKSAFTKHMLVFRHGNSLGSLKLKQEVPEILITNSHDRASSVSINFGIFKLICTNGLVVQTSAFGDFKVRHTGDVDLKDQVIDATFKLVENAPTVIGQIDAWKGIELTRPEQMEFARAALPLLENDSLKPEEHASQLLRTRRPEDNDRSLWTTLNKVQENGVKGGISYRGTTGRRNTTREIKNIDRDVRLNQQLWALTEGMARLKANQN